VKDILKHPLLITLISVIIGSGLFNYLTEKRARENARVQQEIEFINETANQINAAIINVYGIIHSDSISSYDIETVDSAIGGLDDNRMNVKIKSMAYFSDTSFYDNYISIQEELDDMSRYLESVQNNSFDSIKDLSYIKTRILSLQNEWKLNPVTKTEHESPFKELYIWTELIEDRTESILSDALKKSIK